MLTAAGGGEPPEGRGDRGTRLTGPHSPSLTLTDRQAQVDHAGAPVLVKNSPIFILNYVA